jgi:single-strand DNA-binding protein
MQKNRIELAGYLAAKPEVRYLPSGTPVANARLAEGYRYTNRDEQVQEHTNWHSIVFYGDLSEIALGFDKGDNVFVEGTLQTRKFTPRDGSQRTVYEVVARSAHQIVRRNGKEAASDNAPDAKEGVVPGHEEQLENPDDSEIWPS